MTYRAQLNSPVRYQLKRGTGISPSPSVGTFRELTEALLVEMGCTTELAQLVNGARGC